MVASSLDVYLNAFLYSLVLAAGATVPLAELTGKASDVAFLLYERWTDGRRGRPAVAVSGANWDSRAPEEEAEEEEGLVFAWQVSEEPLPPDLAAILAQAVSGGLKLDLKGLLEQLPVWQGIKARPEENNHRQDGKSAFDKTLKAAQQKWVTLLRMHAALHSTLADAPQEIVSLSQQIFAYGLLAENDLVKERKRRSIPTTVGQPNGLFTSDDMKHAKEHTNIQKQGVGFGNNSCSTGTFQYQPLPCRFRSYTGYRWKFKGGFKSGSSMGGKPWPWRPPTAQWGKGKGKGKGKGACPANFCSKWHCDPIRGHCASSLFGDCTPFISRCGAKANMFAREVDFSVGSKRNSILRSSSTPETSSQFAVVENIRTPPL
jgi:hypothetical protein